MITATAFEVSASSHTGFDDAINRGIYQACRRLRDLRQFRGASVNDQQICVEEGKPTSYRVKLQVTFAHESD